MIELLVVIAIIGILATIVLVSLNTARAKARDARRSSDMHQIALAMEMYYDSQSPSTYLPLPVANVSIPAASAIGTYLNPVPLDPSNSGSQIYKWVGQAAAAPSTWYCAWVQLEVPAATWVVSNPNGTKQVPAVPTDAGCKSL